MNGRCQPNLRVGAGGGSAARRSRRRYRAPAALFALAVVNGLLTLWISACSCAPLSPAAVFGGYFARPLTAALNLVPPVLLMALGYFLTGRAWSAYLLSAVPSFGLALANYYKIQLRGDPLVFADLRLVRTAGGIVGHYRLDVPVSFLLLLLVAVLSFLLCLFLLPERPRGAAARMRGSLLCLSLCVLFFALLSCRSAAAPSAAEPRDAESYASDGFWLSFLSGVGELPRSPSGYNASAAVSAFQSNDRDADIPAGQKVQVVGVMLESFCDLTDFPMLAELPRVASVYAPLHELEARSVSGDLITNIFSGGTVDTEWGYLTGYSRHDEFTAELDTYVRYFKAQGYDTVFRHPGHGWFYGRETINRYLGFDESMFAENGFGALVDPDDAIYRSDAVVFDYLLAELESRPPEDAPLFSFTVTYQNHGPYGADLFDGARVLPEDTGWSEESCGILSHYLYTVEDTVTQLLRFTDGLDALDSPVVLVLFGDHKPWLGNDKAVYRELGVDLALDTEQGFRNIFETPYLIWANRAAKTALGRPFSGSGGDISPCLLMEELFDCCGWDGPAFMQLARDMRARSPLLHQRGRFLVDGEFLSASELSGDVLSFYLDYRAVEYWREHHGLEA